MTAPASGGVLGVAEVLDRAADLIEPVGAWTQHVFARNAAGKPTGLSAFSGPPVCYCALGATSYAAGDNSAADSAADALLRDIVGGDIDEWNDAPGRTQAEVVAALRSAAEAARAGEV